MKKIALFALILLVSGCNKNTINLKYSSIEYGSTVYLYDLVDIQNGFITSPNELINTFELGNENIKLTYKSGKNEYSYDATIKIVDTTKPLIHSSSVYTVEKGKNIDLLGKILYGDNYDRDVSISIIGSYDVNTLGEYPLKFVAIDSSGNRTEKVFKLKVVDKIENGINAINYFKFDDFKKNYKSDNTMLGIDVSVWQGNIDWEKVKEAGVEFAMIRIGWGHNNDSKMVFDTKYFDNIKNAKENGIKIGLYFYSYASNTSQAIEQAEWIINSLDGMKLDLPITFDWECWSNFDDYKINFVDLNLIAKAFLNKIEEYGYDGMLYGSMNYLNSIWNLPDYDTWLAHYASKTSYDKNYYLWQLSSSGLVDGINGAVDFDVLYKKNFG